MDAFLRCQPDDLTADGDEAFVLPQGAGAISGAVDDDLFLQFRQVGRIVEFDVFETAAGEQEVGFQLTAVIGDIEG